MKSKLNIIFFNILLPVSIIYNVNQFVQGNFPFKRSQMKRNNASEEKCDKFLKYSGCRFLFGGNEEKLGSNMVKYSIALKLQKSYNSRACLTQHAIFSLKLVFPNISLLGLSDKSMADLSSCAIKTDLKSIMSEDQNKVPLISIENVMIPDLEYLNGLEKEIKNEFQIRKILHYEVNDYLSNLEMKWALKINPKQLHLVGVNLRLENPKSMATLGNSVKKAMEQAIQHIGSKTNNTVFIIFMNSYSRALENMVTNFSYNIDIVSFFYPKLYVIPNHFDLVLMTRLEAVIMMDDFDSFWAVYLGFGTGVTIDKKFQNVIENVRSQKAKYISV